MLKSIYTPLSGALAQEKVLDIIANNLANVNTVGFKEEKVAFKVLDPEPEKNYKNPLPPANYKIDLEHLHPLRGNEIDYVEVSGVFRDDQQGPAIKTGNSFDLMIEGEGYFQVNTQEGPRFTRNGSFSLNQDGALTDKLGNPVLGENGAIFVKSTNFEVNRKGEVIQDGKLIDKLKLVKFSDPNQIEKVGLNYYFHSGPEEFVSTIEHPNVKQGFLEGSNVNPVKNLTSMILAHRSYEAYQKAIKNVDNMMEKSSNTIGAVRA
jgi:flagellar basal-body rod protein FlgG